MQAKLCSSETMITRVFLVSSRSLLCSSIFNNWGVVCEGLIRWFFFDGSPSLKAVPVRLLLLPAVPSEREKLAQRHASCAAETLARKSNQPLKPSQGQCFNALKGRSSFNGLAQLAT
eukprot:4527907-Amphidinium_carterae.1